MGDPETDEGQTEEQQQEGKQEDEGAEAGSMEEREAVATEEDDAFDG